MSASTATLRPTIATITRVKSRIEHDHTPSHSSRTRSLSSPRRRVSRGASVFLCDARHLIGSADDRFLSLPLLLGVDLCGPGRGLCRLYGTSNAPRCPVTSVTLEPGHPLRRPLLTRNGWRCTFLRGSMPPDGTLFTTGCGLSRRWMLLMGYKGKHSLRAGCVPCSEGLYAIFNTRCGTFLPHANDRDSEPPTIHPSL
jgi:hypothetical protein